MSSAIPNLHKVVIASIARTPVGSFRGKLSHMTAPQLGAIAVKAAVERAGIKPEAVEEVYMGNVLQAGVGQAPARQVIFGAGLPATTEATTINKVCASGMKAITLAAQALQLGDRGIMVAGGMESMSQTPYYVQRNLTYGNQGLLDSIVHDGLTDVYDQVAMGVCADETAEHHKITREEQDNYAIQSYKKAAEAWANGMFKDEVIPISWKDRKGNTVTVDTDEEFSKVDFKKVPTLRPVFKSNGTVTAANASKINDGASAVVLMSEGRAQALNVKPLAEIIAYADAACEPKKFTEAPSLVIPAVLQKAQLTVNDISLFEINEAFSVVALVNQQLLGIDSHKLNVAGGGVALGHPIGSSGARIVVSLTNLLKAGQLGCAAICNGGGAATAIIIRKL